MPTEVEKLEAHSKEHGYTLKGVTPGPAVLALPPEERAEAIAKEINRINKWLEDPINSLLSRVGGKLFTLSESTMERSTYDPVSGDFVPVVLTERERWDRRSKLDTAALFRECVKMIEDLRDGKTPENTRFSS